MPSTMEAEKRRRADALRNIAEDVTALCDRVVSSTRFERSPGVGEDGISRRRPERGTHHFTGPGLITQLVAAALTAQRGVADEGGVRRGRPAGKEPGVTVITETLRDIDVRAALTLQRLRTLSAAPVPPVRARRTVVGDIRMVRGCVHAVGDPVVVADVAEEIRRWVRCARFALTYESPTYALPHPCRDCGGQLRVPMDGESPVRCVGTPASPQGPAREGCRDEEGRPRAWPRGHWNFLLDRLLPDQSSSASSPDIIESDRTRNAAR